MAKLNGKYIFCIIYPVALLTAVVNLFLACSNSQMAEDPEIFWEEKIEECSDDEIGDVYYYVAEAEYKKCENGQWLHVDIKSSAHDTLQIPTDTSIIENYICENGEFLKCEDKKQVHVDVDVKPLDSLDFPTDTAEASSDTIPEIDLPECVDGDKRYKASDSSYVECKNGQWEPIRESWTIIPVSKRFLPVVQGKFIPNANFNTPFTLQPPQALNKGNVKCTFDGSEPDSTTPAFTENRTIDSTTVVRCYEFVGNEIKQKQTETYFINESIDMPVVSISVNPVYVRDYLDAKPCEPHPCFEAKFWEDVEYPTHVEYFAEGSSAKEKGFEIDAGISIAGNYTRNQEKKSVSIVMRKQYQDGRLHYPLFETRPENNKFKAFILRNNGNRFPTDYMGDAVATSLLEGTNVDYQRSRQVIVFYNGQYRGIYDMREKLNEHFVETNYGINHNNVDFIKLNGIDIDLKNGSSKEYEDLMETIKNENYSENEAAYKAIKEKIDINNFIEYMAAEIYYRNEDWPDNNVRAWKSSSTSWRFIAFDTDIGFGLGRHISGFSNDENIINWAVHGGKKKNICDIDKGNKCFNLIFAKLIQNSTFKQAFINRAVYLYSSYINSKKVAERVNAIYNSIDAKQMTRDQKIYTRQSNTNSCGQKFDYKGDCLKSWSTTRDQSVRDDIRNYFNLGNDVPISIEIEGKGRLKLDGAYITQSDTYNWEAFENNPIELEVECYAGAKFQTWENGSKSSKRTIYPKESTIYTAICQ